MATVLQTQIKTRPAFHESLIID